MFLFFNQEVPHAELVEALRGDHPPLHAFQAADGLAADGLLLYSGVVGCCYRGLDLLTFVAVGFFFLVRHGRVDFSTDRGTSDTGGGKRRAGKISRDQQATEPAKGRQFHLVRIFLDPIFYLVHRLASAE